MSGPRVLVVGLSCLDHVWRVERFPPTGSRTHASDYRMQGGGPGATAAVAAARLGADAALWALHGDDANGRHALSELEAHGVDVSGVRALPGATTFVSAVLVDPAGERHIFPYRGAKLDDDPALWPPERLDAADALLTDGRHPRIAASALAAARSRGVPTVGDWSNARHWELTVEVDHLIVSEECATEVSGGRDPEAALGSLRGREDQVVGITLGGEGFLFDDGQDVRHVPALPVEVVDTNGAGDVFHGAYAYGVARGFSAARCGLFASVAAALSCTGVGRSAIPDAATVEHLLETRTLAEMREMRWT